MAKDKLLAGAAASLSMAELEELAVELKNEEQSFLADIKARKSAVRDEIVGRARRDYAGQRLRGMGVEPTEALIDGILAAKPADVPPANVVVTPETYRGTLEAH